MNGFLGINRGVGGNYLEGLECQLFLFPLMNERSLTSDGSTTA